ncbi:hypothetical protein AAFF_G00131530 [Aldrovandia affinis]|uniref:PDZ domain-containing protein n=1 Tax=Aldrovandia affinis TaxID=143900 RepID=A0AAD7W9L7_9TELE|nr:hypothetical protein AAFF_G00131530 [Aldrovandia affinis]
MTLRILNAVSPNRVLTPPLSPPGDVIVYINDVCVLGTTHADVVKLFQSVPIGQSVTLVLCRGYPLPYDPEDSGSSGVPPPMGLMERPGLVNGRSSYDSYMEYVSRTARFVQEGGDQLLGPPPPHMGHPGDAHLDGPAMPPPPAPYEDSVSMASSGATQAELMTLTIVKGADGFGFTIADSPTGQRVKQVLEPQGCPGLREGDLIAEINRQSAHGLSHAQVVELLKECAVGAETSLLIQRGGAECRSHQLYPFAAVQPQIHELCSDTVTGHVTAENACRGLMQYLRADRWRLCVCTPL